MTTTGPPGWSCAPSRDGSAGDRDLRRRLCRRPRTWPCSTGQRREVDAATPGRRIPAITAAESIAAAATEHGRWPRRRSTSAVVPGRRAGPAGGRWWRPRPAEFQLDPELGRSCTSSSDGTEIAWHELDRLETGFVSPEPEGLGGVGRPAEIAPGRTGPSRSPVPRSPDRSRWPSKCGAGCGICCPSGRTSGSGCARRRWPSRAEPRVDHRLRCPPTLIAVAIRVPGHPQCRELSPNLSPVAEVPWTPAVFAVMVVLPVGVGPGAARSGSWVTAPASRIFPTSSPGHPDHQRGLGAALEMGSGDGVTERVTGSPAVPGTPAVAWVKRRPSGAGRGAVPPRCPSSTVTRAAPPSPGCADREVGGGFAVERGHGQRLTEHVAQPGRALHARTALRPQLTPGEGQASRSIRAAASPRPFPTRSPRRGSRRLGSATARSSRPSPWTSPLTRTDPKAQNLSASPGRPAAPGPTGAPPPKPPPVVRTIEPGRCLRTTRWSSRRPALCGTVAVEVSGGHP